MDVLVSHECGHFGRARREIRALLKRFGDLHPEVIRSGVDGIALVRTSLDARAVAQRCRELLDQAFVFRFALKWVPVDFWCRTDLEALQKLLKEQVRPQIATDESWGLRVIRHQWEHATQEIVTHLAKAIDRRVDLEHPDKLIQVNVLGEQTAISVLHPGDVFSVPGGARALQPKTSKQDNVAHL